MAYQHIAAPFQWAGDAVMPSSRPSPVAIMASVSNAG
jgi:hypothetical protein